jgi:hypothetical protein
VRHFRDWRNERRRGSAVSSSSLVAMIIGN